MRSIEPSRDCLGSYADSFSQFLLLHAERFQRFADLERRQEAEMVTQGLRNLRVGFVREEDLSASTALVDAKAWKGKRMDATIMLDFGLISDRRRSDLHRIALEARVRIGARAGLFGAGTARGGLLRHRAHSQPVVVFPSMTPPRFQAHKTSRNLARMSGSFRGAIRAPHDPQPDPILLRARNQG